MILVSTAVCLKFKSQIEVNNGNCTEWSAIWCEIKRVITKLHDREAGVNHILNAHYLVKYL